MSLISVLIVDDHPIVLKGTKMLFNELDDFYIETETNAEQVLSRIQKEEFHVYLIDINMAKKNGIELAKGVKAIQEQAIVILYTGDDIHSYYSLLIEKKVDGILSKTAPIEQVIYTIRSIVVGSMVIPIDFIDYINKKMKNRYDSIKLTNKEIQLIKMLIDGDTNKEIAARFNVTQRTVERYIAQLFSLLGVSSRIEVIDVVKEKQLI